MVHERGHLGGDNTTSDSALLVHDVHRRGSKDDHGASLATTHSTHPPAIARPSLALRHPSPPPAQTRRTTLPQAASEAGAATCACVLRDLPLPRTQSCRKWAPAACGPLLPPSRRIASTPRRASPDCPALGTRPDSSRPWTPARRAAGRSSIEITSTSGRLRHSCAQAWTCHPHPLHTHYTHDVPPSVSRKAPTLSAIVVVAHRAHTRGRRHFFPAPLLSAPLPRFTPDAMPHESSRIPEQQLVLGGNVARDNQGPDGDIVTFRPPHRRTS